MQSKAMLLLIVVSAIIFQGCRKSDGLVLSSAQSAVQSDAKFESVTITMTFTSQDENGVWLGTFITTGSEKLPPSGTCTMAAKGNGNSGTIHCDNILTAPGGTITIQSRCEFATDPSKGQWNIKSGTGDYADLKGNGSLLMPEAEEGPIEVLTGKIF